MSYGPIEGGTGIRRCFFAALTKAGPRSMSGTNSTCPVEWEACFSGVVLKKMKGDFNMLLVGLFRVNRLFKTGKKKPANHGKAFRI